MDNEGTNRKEIKKALRLFFDRAYTKKSIDYLVVVSSNIFGEIEEILLRGELGLYKSELITIKEK